MKWANGRNMIMEMKKNMLMELRLAMIMKMNLMLMLKRIMDMITTMVIKKELHTIMVVMVMVIHMEKANLQYLI